MKKKQLFEVLAEFDETIIEESESGIFRVYGRNRGEQWQGIGSTASKSEAIDMRMDWSKKVKEYDGLK